MTAAAVVEADGVFIAYENRRTGELVPACREVTLSVAGGEFVTLVGPSGCGKTSFLRAVDGLVPIGGGSLRVKGAQVQGPGRDRAMVFQAASLLPWRTVVRNVAYGLDLQGVAPRDAVGRARSMLELVGLQGFEQYYPHELSGGMQQRVNLARALVVEPDVLLMDEPLGALDAQTRERMQGELMRIASASGKTVLFVTHDIAEAVFLGDRVVVFSARPGRIKSVIDVPFDRPRPARVKRDPAFLDLVDAIWQMIDVPSEEATASAG